MSKCKIRTNTKVINVGGIKIGGYNEIVIQTMTTTKTSDIENTIKQINDLKNYGAQLVRVAVLDEQDAESLSEIVHRVNVPIIADIHYNYKFALIAIKAGVAKIRINPGNIGNVSQVLEIIHAASHNNIPIRIGINGGSFIFKNDEPIAQQLFDCALHWIKFLEKAKFYNFIVSIKHSDVNVTKEANIKLAKKCKYPIHLGVTETGPTVAGITKSCAALVPLLELGIGNTIRISVNGDRKNEIKTARILLHSLGFNVPYYDIVACPLCGRNLFNTTQWVKEIDEYLETKHIVIKVGIMGCSVNGPGEAKGCNIAVCVKDSNTSQLFENGNLVGEINNKDVVITLKKLIDKKI